MSSTEDDAASIGCDADNDDDDDDDGNRKSTGFHCKDGSVLPAEADGNAVGVDIRPYPVKTSTKCTAPTREVINTKAESVISTGALLRRTSPSILVVQCCNDVLDGR